MTGERFDAETALRIGLVHEVAGDLDGAVERIVAELLTAGPEAARAAKALARAPLSAEETARLIAERRASDEGQRGPARVPRRRPPGPPRVRLVVPAPPGRQSPRMDEPTHQAALVALFGRRPARVRARARPRRPAEQLRTRSPTTSRRPSPGRSTAACTGSTTPRPIRLNAFQPLAEQELLFLFVTTGKRHTARSAPVPGQLAILVAVYGCSRRLGFDVRAAACGSLLVRNVLGGRARGQDGAERPGRGLVSRRRRVLPPRPRPRPPGAGASGRVRRVRPRSEADDGARGARAGRPGRLSGDGGRSLPASRAGSLGS